MVDVFKAPFPGLSLITPPKYYTLLLANVSLLDDTKDILSSLVSQGMEKVRNDIAIQIGKEVRAEMVEQTDELMRDLSALRGVKQAVDLGLERINSTSDYISEAVEAINLLDNKLDGINRGRLTKMAEISQTLAGKATQVELGLSRSQPYSLRI